MSNFLERTFQSVTNVSHVDEMSDISFSSFSDDFMKGFLIQGKEKQAKVFGATLDSTNVESIPHLVDELIDYILKKKKVEGIFRKPGFHADCQKFIKKVESGKKYSIEKDLGFIHNAASIFKLYLRELKTPLIPVRMVTESMKYQVKLNNKLVGKNKRNFKKIICTKLTPPQRVLLKKVCHFIVQFAEFKDKTKMSISNLSIVFGPNIIKQDLSQNTIMENGELVQMKGGKIDENKLVQLNKMRDVGWINVLMQHLLEQYVYYFEKPYKPRKKKQKSQPKSPQSPEKKIEPKIVEEPTDNTCNTLDNSFGEAENDNFEKEKEENEEDAVVITNRIIEDEVIEVNDASELQQYLNFGETQHTPKKKEKNIIAKLKEKEKIEKRKEKLRKFEQKKREERFLREMQSKAKKKKRKRLTLRAPKRPLPVPKSIKRRTIQFGKLNFNSEGFRNLPVDDTQNWDPKQFDISNSNDEEPKQISRTIPTPKGRSRVSVRLRDKRMSLRNENRTRFATNRPRTTYFGKPLSKFQKHI